MTPTLFAACVLPGCNNPVSDPTQPCDDCLAAFGEMLQPTDRPLTAEQVADRDQEVRDAHRVQAELAMTAERRATIDTGDMRKPGQVCWLCEERRLCTKTAFCLPEFTVAELRRVYEAVWGRPLDPRNFHRKVTGAPDFLVPTGSTTTRDGGRPAQLYRRGPARLLHPPLLRADE